MEKRVNLRVEHIKHSGCRLDFLKRVKSNAALKLAANKEGRTIDLKRRPVQPRPMHYVSTKGNMPVTIAPVAYEALV